MTLTVQSKPDHLKSRGSGPDDDDDKKCVVLLLCLEVDFCQKHSQETRKTHGYLHLSLTKFMGAILKCVISNIMY